MGLFDLFRKPPPIATLPALEDFLDSRAAFLVQKCLFEYCRARAGLMWQKLFKEEAFRAAVERARWQNYPIGLETVTLMAEQALRPHAGADAAAMRQGLAAAAGNVTSRYPVPAGFEPEFWAEARRRIAGRIDRAGLAAPLPVKDLPTPTAEEFFANMPIHASLRGGDFVLVRNNLRFNLCRAHEEFTARADLPALAGAAIAGPTPVVLPAAARPV